MDEMMQEMRTGESKHATAAPRLKSVVNAANQHEAAAAAVSAAVTQP